MMPAAKHGDMQIGVDIHLCMVPPGVPTPLPTPHMSVVFDPFDYVPILGATVTVCGMKRATAGTSGKVVHIPPGFPFAPKMPDTEDEIFMGSATVDADGDPFSHIAHPVLACQMVGMISPFRKKKKGGPRAMVLPTVFNLAIPTTVFIGGPPTISLMGLAVKGAFSALGKLAKSKVFKRLRQKVFKNMKPGFLKCVVLRAEPVNILDGSVSVDQEDFQLPGRLTIEWLRTYSSLDAHVGLCGRGWQTPADIRLEVDAADGSVLMQAPGIGPLSFEGLPAQPGEASVQWELGEGARLIDLGDEWQVLPKGDRIYHFPKSLASRDERGTGIAPIGRISDRCGNALVFEHLGGHPIAITEPETGRRLVLTIHNQRLHAVTLVDGPTGLEHGFVRYDYDTAGNLAAVVDAMGAPYSFAYAGHGMVRHTDRNGLSFHYAYDDQSRVVRAWGDGDLYNYAFEYLDPLKQRRITDSLGQVSTIQLNDAGLPICEIDPLDGQTIFEYDEAGRTTAVTDPAGRRTEYAFDAQGNQIGTTHPDGSSVAVAYDPLGNASAVTDPRGGLWLQRWDARGLLIEQTTPLGHVTRYEYDDRGGLSASTDARGFRTTLTVDRNGLLRRQVDAQGHATEFIHDPLGRLMQRTDALGQATRFEYDIKGRLTAVEQPSGARVSCSYDLEDNLTAFVDENGGTTRLDYFGQGEIARRIQPDGGVVEYHYDTEEQLVAVRNQLGQVFALRRDALGRVVEESDYWGNSRHFFYDGSGHLIEEVDPLGRRTQYTCDPLGRLLQRSAPDPSGGLAPWIESFAYDPDGNLVAARNAHCVLAFEFDADGQPVLESQEHSTGERIEVENTYDEASNRVGRTTRCSSGAVTTAKFVYDSLDQVTETHVDGRPLLRCESDPLGRVRHETIGSLSRDWRYDADGHLVQQSVRCGRHPTVELSYRYDFAGNLVQRRDGGGSVEQWIHDPMDRVTQHVDPRGRVERILHDAAGNRLSTHAQAAPPHAASHDLDPENTRVPPSRNATREGRCGDATYRFDQAGCLVARDLPELQLRLAWDAEQRLVASTRRGTDGDDETTHYGYDPLGRRLFKQTVDERTWFGWDGDVLAIEGTRAFTREYLMRNDSFEPLVLKVTAAADGEARLACYVNDPNGAPCLLLDLEGRTLWDRTAPPTAASIATNPLRLQGQYEDVETGLCYARYRYYIPELGQFASADPLRLEAGENLYAYAPNESAWIDPLGLKKCRIKAKMGSPPAHLKNKNPHRHHIVMEGKFTHWKAKNRKLVKDAQAILKKHKIDIQDKPNIVWAQNAGHSVEYAEKVLARLQKADKGRNAAKKVAKALEAMGRELGRGPSLR